MSACCLLLLLLLLLLLRFGLIHLCAVLCRGATSGRSRCSQTQRISFKKIGREGGGGRV